MDPNAEATPRPQILKQILGHNSGRAAAVVSDVHALVIVTVRGTARGRGNVHTGQGRANVRQRRPSTGREAGRENEEVEEEEEEAADITRPRDTPPGASENGTATVNTAAADTRQAIQV